MFNYFKERFFQIYKQKILLRDRVRFASHVVVSGRKCIFDGANSVGRDSFFRDSHLGYASYIGERGYFVCTDIGKYTCIGHDVKIIVGSHPIREFVSMHPAFFSVRNQAGVSYVEHNKFQELKFVDAAEKVIVKIGNDVWIGSGASILQGITVGDGAVVAAGAVVVNNVPPFAIVAGIPAKIIKYRFKEQEIRCIQSLKWWNKPEKWIIENADKFGNVDKFLELAEEEKKRNDADYV